MSPAGPWARGNKALRAAAGKNNEEHLEKRVETKGRRNKRSRWRMTVWFVLVACVAFLAYILSYGFFHSGGFMLQLEGFVGFFVVGCILLALSRRSAKKKERAGS